MSNADRRSQYGVLLWLVPLALLHGLLYMWLVPPWQHYDEPGHFLYAAQLAGNAPEGIRDARMGREVADSMERHAFFTPESRPDLINFNPQILGLDQQVHPPLYYALAALPLRATAHLGVDQQLYAARLLSVVLYTLTIVVAWRIAVAVVPDEPLPQIILPLILLLMPTFVDIMTAVNSDVLINFAGAVTLLGCVFLVRDGMTPGGLILTGLGIIVALLAKRTAVAVLAPVLLALIWSMYRQPLPRRWVGTIIGGGAVVLVLSLTITNNNGLWVLTPREWIATIEQQYLRLDLTRFFQSVITTGFDLAFYGAISGLIFTSFWTHLGWGHIQLAAPIAYGVIGVAFVAGIGLIRRIWQLHSILPLWQRRCLWLFGISIAAAWALTILRVHPFPLAGTPSYLPRGRYILWAALPTIWLLTLGIQGLLPARRQPYGPAALVILMAILNGLALFAVWNRYY
jgi:hypothetical protein